jgi:hypothetical protein
MVQRDVESFADFIQYYQHKFVRSRNDPALMFYVNGPMDRERPNRRLMMTGYRNGLPAGEDMYTEQQVWDAVQFGLPSIGMTVVNDQELLYLYYRTSRNGGRGFGVDRVIQHSFNGLTLQGYGLAKFRPADLVQPPNAWRALEPGYVTLTKAWEDFQTGPDKLAYALSRVFGVYLSHKDHPTLCYRTTEIGDVLGPNKVSLYKKQAEYLDPIRRVLNPEMEIEIYESR